MANQFSSTTFMRLNNHGQSLVILVIVFPALFLLWSLSLKTYQFLNFKEESLHICRKNLLKYQQKNLDGIEQLHRLNPQAKVLRIKRKSAEVAYFAAKRSLNPKLVAITWAYLKKVKLEQQAFATLQKSLKFKTELQANYLLQELKFKVSKLHYVKLSPDFKGQKTLALKLEPRSSTTPDYVLRRQFSQKQKMQMSWQIVFLEKMKPITLSCSATIIAKDRPWSITLSHADKL